MAEQRRLGRGGSTTDLKLTQLGSIASTEPRECWVFFFFPRSAWYINQLRLQAALLHLGGLDPKEQEAQGTCIPSFKL